MKAMSPYLFVFAGAAFALLAACSSTNKSPDVSDNVRASLRKAGYKDVSVSEDRDKGVVTLGGQVASDSDKEQADSIARSVTGNLVVADQIAVVPQGAGGDVKKMNSDLDKGIANNVDAALINERLNAGVKYSVKNHVVTLTGHVDSEASRAKAQDVAAAVPNVQQVVNEIQVVGQKASSSN